jgi:hypothetical protein
VYDARSVGVGKGVSDLLADLCHPLPGQSALPGDLGAERQTGDQSHDDPRHAILLDHVINRDHPGMVQPGHGPRLTHRAGHHVSAGGVRQALRQQHLLDRHLAVEHLVMAAPHPAHAALADRLQQAISLADQHSHPTRHAGMIGEERPSEISNS